MRGQRGRLAQFQHSGTPRAADQGRSLTLGKFCPMGSGKPIGCIARYHNSKWRSCGLDRKQHHNRCHFMRIQAGASFQTARNFSGTEVHKKQTLAVLCQPQRLCSGWNTLLINNEMINPGFNVLEVHQEAQWAFCYQQFLQRFALTFTASHLHLLGQ